jgi:hypothetical protein
MNEARTKDAPLVYTECCALYAKSTAFCPYDGANKILSLHRRIIHADLSLPRLINKLRTRIANPLRRP